MRLGPHRKQIQRPSRPASISSCLLQSSVSPGACPKIWLYYNTTQGGGQDLFCPCNPSAPDSCQGDGQCFLYIVETKRVSATNESAARRCSPSSSCAVIRHIAAGDSGATGARVNARRASRHSIKRRAPNSVRGKWEPQRRNVWARTASGSIGRSAASPLTATAALRFAPGPSLEVFLAQESGAREGARR